MEKEKENVAVSFGLTVKDIEIIEKRVSAFEGAKYSYPVWIDIGREIGWDALTAALWYFRRKEYKGEIDLELVKEFGGIES